jgi:hypothetical protein
MARNKIDILIPCKTVESQQVSKVVASMGMRANADFVVPQQADILFMRSILVSTGENKNDDVFVPGEMWAARSTPILKPVDWEHNTGRELTPQEQIQNPGKVVVDNQTIGVMYNTYAIDENGATIDEAKASATDFQAPDNFHIVDEAVIWKGIYPTVAKRIEDGAAAGTLFVSMEAWFTDYNYLVGNKVVARNEQTAFLDNSLRANGGTGSYGSNRVRRVLRNITFGGKGIVARPANEPSVITHVSHEPISAKASLNNAIAKNIICDIRDTKASQPRKETEMSDNANNAEKVSLDLFTKANNELVDLRTEAKSKDAELATANSKVAELQAQIESITSAFTKGSSILEESLPGFASRVSEGNPENFFSVLAERLGEDSAAKVEIEQKLADALAKIEQTEVDARTAAREAKIDNLLGIAAFPDFLKKKKDDKDGDKKMDEKDKEKAGKLKARKDKMMAAVDGLNDEQFDALYDVWAEQKAEADEMKRGSLPAETGGDMNRGAQKGHPHGTGASDKALSQEELIQEVIARMVANPNKGTTSLGAGGGGDAATPNQGTTSLGTLEDFQNELAKGSNDDSNATVQDIISALAGHQEPTDEENLSLILDSVKASEQTPSAGEEAPEGVDLRQSFSGLVGKMLGRDDEEK